MIESPNPRPQLAAPSRRRFLGGLGTATLSATAMALLAGAEARARGESIAERNQGMAMRPQRHQTADNPGQDVTILNVALGLEHEAINAYQLGAESGLLQKPVLEVAVLFQAQHKQHRDALVAAIRNLGGRPVAEKSLSDYASGLGADGLRSQADVLMLAARLELGAANAYLGVMPSFEDPGLAQVAGRLAADETMHWTVLAQALGQPLPSAALSFGA